MSVRVDVIHIGTLSKNLLWNERSARRPSVATMTLLTDDKVTVLVDPGLPPELIAGALDQRTGRKPDDITMVFLTNRRAAHTRGIAAFPKAKIYMFELEIEALSADPAVPKAALARLEPAPERLTEGIHIFPTPGPTRGHCSLLIPGATSTIFVAGDAVLTRDHYERGMIFEGCENPDSAKESLAEIVEMADLIVPGHDNIFPARQF